MFLTNKTVTKPRLAAIGAVALITGVYMLLARRYSVWELHLNQFRKRYTLPNLLVTLKAIGTATQLRLGYPRLTSPAKPF